MFINAIIACFQSKDRPWYIVSRQGLDAEICWADPTPAVLQAFDDLLLLKSGGLVTYHGSLGKNSCRLIEYFQVQPPCPAGPAISAAPSALEFMRVCSEEQASVAVVGLLQCLYWSSGHYR